MSIIIKMSIIARGDRGTWKMNRIIGFGVFVVVLAAASSAQTDLPDPTTELLTQLIRIDSTNPPGNDERIADLLASKLAPLGFQVETIPTPVSGKVHFLARLKGRGTKKPILLAAHADVVGVERAGWHLDPFAGLLQDGYVYGRGAIDNKGSLAVFTAALIRLAKEKVPLERDLILLSEADEESGRYGTEWLAENYFQKIDCAAALNEGGWIIQNSDGSVRYVSISTADKISIWFKLTSHGTTTHSSMPVRNDDAISQLARALADLANYRTRVQLLSSTRQFFLTLAQVSKPPKSEEFKRLVEGTNQEVAEADLEISKDPLLNAIIRNTLAPVFLNAGFRGNVIPGTAEATINLRLLPGTNIDQVIDEVRNVVHNPQIDVAISGGGGPGTSDDVQALRDHFQAVSNIEPSRTDTELYQALALQGQAQFHAPVTPYLFQAGTDAAAWRKRGIPVYGIYPYPVPASDLSRMHGNDERVSVRSLARATDFIYDVLLHVAGPSNALPTPAK
jgi:acetylornithine deacetylase/succinyl-diaminopimelate desuccinylase-like protein